MGEIFRMAEGSELGGKNNRNAIPFQFSLLFPKALAFTFWGILIVERFRSAPRLPWQGNPKEKEASVAKVLCFTLSWVRASVVFSATN